MSSEKQIILDHGTGAKLSQELIKQITSWLGEVHIGKMEDSAILDIKEGKIAMTTDSFVVDPVSFGNGDIGKIAVCGTVNDLAVMGATPKYITLALMLEVGFPIDELEKIILSIKETALEAGVKIVAGDTKVVNKGEVDKIFINTAGIGIFERPALSMNNVKSTDKIILTGYLGNHSIHLLSIREGLGFETKVLSDCAPLNHVISDLLDSNLAESVKSIRDVTRGGFAEVCHEYAQGVNKNVTFDYDKLPLQNETIMAADMLGVDPIHLANEGCLCLFVEEEKADDIIKYLSKMDYCKESKIVGSVSYEDGSNVFIKKGDSINTLEQLEGAELPRLC